MASFRNLAGAQELLLPGKTSTDAATGEARGPFTIPNKANLIHVRYLNLDASHVVVTCGVFSAGRVAQRLEKGSSLGALGGFCEGCDSAALPACGYTAAVQCAHFVACSGIVDKQKGHGLVAAGAWRFMRLAERITRKIAKATIRKLKTWLKNMP